MDCEVCFFIKVVLMRARHSVIECRHPFYKKKGGGGESPEVEVQQDRPDFEQLCSLAQADCWLAPNTELVLKLGVIL